MNLSDFQAILDASTPDGRWNLLQDFLKRNPDWRAKVDRWLTLDPDTAVVQLKIDLAQRLNIAPMYFNMMITADMERKAREAIEQLQTLYRERQNNQPEQQKEIKNVRTKRAVKVGPARRNPKRAGKDRD